MKLFKYIFFILFLITLKIDAQSINAQLSVADSLFSARRYTQSLDLYKDVYNSGQATPAMLLKMAYSEEALDNLGNALVYLHDYHRFTSDDKVLDKMDELAQVNALEGYKESEFEQVESVLKDFRYIIFLVLVALAGVVFAMMFRKFRKHEEKSLGLAVSFVFSLALAIYVLNFTNENPSGIIMTDNAFIMSGPSAAAELIEVVDQGHKVDLVGANDIWVEIIWRGKRAFVRESNIQELL